VTGDECPFFHPLLRGVRTCAQARTVTRRGGPDIACGDAASRARCLAFYQRVRAAALAAQGLEDDLTLLPQSILQKIEYGALAALESMQDVTGRDAGDLVAAAPPVLDGAALARIVTVITEFKLSRRGSA
jgi:hypothetical protein